MIEDIINEAALSQEQASKLKRKGIKYTTDTTKELNGRSAIINLSNIKYKTDSSYINSVAKYCAEISNYGQRIISVPVSEWHKINNTESIESSKNPVGAICRYIKQTPAEFKTKFKGIIFVFYNSSNKSFPLIVDQYKSSEYKTVINLINELMTSDVIQTKSHGGKSPVKDVAKNDNREKDIIVHSFCSESVSKCSK